MASSVLRNHEDEFVIVTKSGLRVTRSKMTLHKDYKVAGDKRILNPSDCEDKLRDTLDTFDQTGLLE